MTEVRINKYLAECGIASRRNAEDFIIGGRVQINDKVVTDLSTKVGENDIVKLDGKVISRQPQKVYIMMNKPKGVVTTCADQFGRKTVLDLLQQSTADKIIIKNSKTMRVFPVGRLDYATQGLLLLTNDGDFARRVMHPSSKIKKTYIARLDKPITMQQIKELAGGVNIDGKKTSPAHVKQKGADAEITISEGRNRQVRRMFEVIGARVLDLKRISVGNLTLGALKSGQWKYIQKPNL